MGTPLRSTDPEAIHLLTLRTERAELLMVPSKELNKLIAGIIARYQEMHGIELFALMILSNHYHILCRAPHGNLWKFAQDINREIAKRVNWLLGRNGHFWSRRYSDQIVLEESDQIEALLYILTNPVHHGLVKSPTSWPGYTSIHQLRTGKAEQYTFTHYTAYKQARLSGSRARLDDFKTTHTLRFSPLPALKASSLKQQWKLLEALVKERTQTLIEERQANNQGFLGAPAVRKQRPGILPRTIKRTKRPVCYTKSPLAKQLFMQAYRAMLSAYIDASYCFRKGELATEFPPFTLKPPLHCVPG